jgi:hypothetical protein
MERARMQEAPLIVVDAANVMGSVPDGWWRDRRGAVIRLRDALDGLSDEGLVEGTPDWARRPPLEVVLVVEGKARGIESSETVRVVSAPGVGDDTIVEVVQRAGTQRPRLVVTADRGLRARVEALGAEVRGPGVLHERRLRGSGG